MRCAIGVASVLGCALAAMPLAAQRPPCKACDTAVDREVESVQRETSRILREFVARQQALGDDTTAVAREKRARLERELGAKIRSLSLRQSRLLDELARRTAEEAQSHVRVPEIQPPRGPGEEPDGWLGFTASGVVAPAPPGVIRYVGYPTIVSVEPGSPAERAGITAGDKLIALDGRDVTAGPVRMEKLLQPGAKIPVRLRRDDITKNVTVSVTRRPSRPFMFYQAEPEPGVRIRSYDPGPMPEARAQVEVHQGMVAPLPFAPGGALAAMGAEFTAIRGDLADYFGTPSGVLVLRVGTGTPAERSGLRGGDVIVAADERDVASVSALQMTFARSTAHSVKLDIVRKRERRTVTLVW